MKPRNIFDPLPDALKRFPVKASRNFLSCIIAAIAIFNTPVLAQDRPAQPSFPDTDTLISRVASHQKDVEALLTQYTLTDKTTLYTLDKAGTVSQQNLEHQEKPGLNFMVSVKSFQGVVDQRKVNGEVCLPSRQDFVAQGRQLVAGFHIRQVSDFSDYLKATTDVFQQIHSPGAAADGPKAQNESRE